MQTGQPFRFHTPSSIFTMEEVYMIPHKDLEQLIQYYKGELTENTLLNKAATLAAKNMCC